MESEIEKRLFGFGNGSEVVFSVYGKNELPENVVLR